ncbi:MAG TPA: T9SS type A sorting domain-containing protein [Ferruginibacter sp.]|nr:T9SS type A sorting domain-containing protein [Ferruginibacter sp.]HMP21478.1 T9SS type A sorting domain-containing protein [Ferruginibacter sp.]
MKYSFYKLTVFCTLLIFFETKAQSNYSLTNFRFQQQAYQDIAATGTAIPMSHAEDGASTNPQDIGFSFVFNGITYTQFMIHADGILKLGNTAPGSATAIAINNAGSYATTFTTTNALFQNILLPFFTNLVQGSAAPEFHVLTSGTAPNRVCTIQWKNLRDADNPAGGQQHQYSNLEFQVKLYETTNDIEFVYGNFTPSASDITAQRRNAACGIKAGSTAFLATYRASSLVPYNKAALLDQPKHARLGTNQFPYNKSLELTSGFTMRFFGQIENDISLGKLYLDSIMPAGIQSPGNIAALIKNEGTATATGIEVTLQITGANTHTETVNIASLNPGQEQLINFPSFTMPNEGAQTITVTATAATDNRPANNSSTAGQFLSSALTQVHDYSRSSVVGVGFNGQSGLIATKMYSTGIKKITQIRLPFNSYRNAVNVRIYEDGGAGGSPSATPIFTSSSFFTTSEQEMIIPVSPAITVDGDYYIAVQQQTTVNMGWGVVINTPHRNTRTFLNNLGTWGNTNDATPWEHLMRVYEESNGPDIGIERLISPTCTYSTDTEVKVSLRNFSSQDIDFGNTPATITGKVTNPSGTEFPFSINKNAGILPAGASEEITVLNSYDFTGRGFHRFDARTNLINDAEPQNDSLFFFINNSIPITPSFTDSICPLTPVTLTGPAYLAGLQWQRSDGFIGSTNPLTFTASAPATVIYTGTDYRGCLLRDSVIIPIKTQGLPPKPQIIFGDTILSHRNGFKDTVRVQKLEGHTIEWLGGIGTVSADSALIINEIAGLQNLKIAVAYRRTADGCANISDTITYSYAPGVLLNNFEPLTVCDTSFYDSGGPGGNTGNSFTRTFTPSTPGQKLKLNIYRLNLSNFASLQVFDGPTASSPRIEALSSTSNGNTIQEFIASNEAGQLTIQYNIGSFVSQGWWGGLTCHTPEVYRTVENGNWTSPTTWEKKAPGSNFVPASRPPKKGDDTVYIRHNITLITSTPMDQVVIEEVGTLNIENPSVNFISMPAYKTVNQPEFLVLGTLNISPRVQIFGLNGEMVVKGALNNFGEIDFDSVLFNGTTAQQLGNFSGASGRMKRLSLNNAEGLTLGSDQIITGLGLINGLIHTSGENELTLRSSLDEQNAGNGNAYVNGPLTVELNSGSGNRLYPIGKGGKYRPVILNNSNTNSEISDRITAEVLDGPPPPRTLPPNLTKVSDVRYYRITRIGNSGSDFRVTLPYGDDDEVTDPANLTIAKDDGAGVWLDINGTASGPAPGSIQSGVFQDFSLFALANRIGGLNPLPVVWQHFSAALQQQDVVLHWRTTAEINCESYFIERSKDGRSFETIGNLQCSNNSLGYAYQFVDAKPAAGTYYYRIRQMDKDGKTAYSGIRKLTKSTAGAVVLYPNPAANFVYLAHIPANSSIRIFDAAGRIVLQQHNPGVSASLNVSRLPSGLYQLQLTADKDNTSSYKLQIIR